ncbi:Dodecaprenyl-phosphate galacturonate synthase [bacterium HR10]|nr:Dodecaprenyl-phosphate galacturonate synthase [bacterium HR10]
MTPVLRQQELDAQAAEAPTYSIVIPLYNEAENVEPLYRELKPVLEHLGAPYEVIFVDDGSQDGTYEVLLALHREDPTVHLVRLSRNFGQTAALAAGFDFAHGAIIIAMDGDLHHDPQDIPRLLETLQQGYDIVSGWRKDRPDDFLTRRLPSRIANWIMARLSGVPLRDFGSTFKAYRREIIKNIRLYGELHRFIPALASLVGARIAEIPVRARPRYRGQSKYGLSRTIRVLLDFITIKFLLSYMTRPLHFFGPVGLLALASGVLLGGYLTLKKFLYGISLLQRHGPLLLLSMLLIITGVQLISIGLIGEIIMRTYYESQRKPIYTIREIRSRREARASPTDSKGA